MGQISDLPSAWACPSSELAQKRVGTVENMPAGPRREKRKCNPCNMLPPLLPMNRRKRLFHMVFMSLCEPEAHGDRSEMLVTCGRLVIGLRRCVTTYRTGDNVF